ncbi:MAG: hypothetical protein V3S56_04545 [Gemmatimonadota bacterium]
MNDLTLLILLVGGAGVAFGVGIWIGLGYPGLFTKYEATGRVPRQPPFEILFDWLYGKFGK